MSTKHTQRSKEIDILRSIALFMMIIHHLVFDTWYLGLSTVHPFTGFMGYWQKITLCTFLLLVGITYQLYAQKYSWQKLYQKQVRRFITIGLCAVSITVITLILIPKQPIYFGVLHCIAISMLILPFIRNQYIAFGSVVGIGIAYIITQQALPFSHNYFAPFHLYNEHFVSLDYVPLLPWLAVIIAGSIIGNVIRPFLSMNSKPESRLQTTLLWPGRNTLLVYLIHQPILIGILVLIRRILL